MIFVLMLGLLFALIIFGQETRGVGVKTTVEKRLALVVGNSDYKTKPLVNPQNDAADMKAALESLGFEVIYGVNLKTKTEMREKINEFGQKLGNGGVGLFYYAGHGVQVDGRNYLIPTNADINNEAEVDLEGVDINYVLGAMSTAKNRFNIVILDACRDNPFKRNWRSIGNDGLAQIKAPSGTMVAYATQPGNTASDGITRNGLYTSQLLIEIKKPNVLIETMFKRVAENVANLSMDKQEPWVSYSIKGDFYFVENAETDPNAAESEAWNRIKNSINRNDFKLFVSNFPNGIYTAQAKIKWEQTWWDSIKNSSKIADFNDFLNRFPSGIYAESAKFALKRLQPVLPPIKPTSSVTLISNKLGMKFANIPAGTFQMGETGDSHTVTLSQSFYLGTTEVTQTQWVSVMFNNPSSFNNCDNCPVENVSWEDVQAFIKKLNDRGDGKYRLPTEAEWEYAARANSTAKYSFGDNEALLGNYAWFDKNSGSKTHEAATKQPNDWGLYDMHGNVWEWVQDWYGDYPTGSVTNPAGIKTGTDKVIRGGSWGNDRTLLQSASRSGYAPSIRDQFLGFRLVRY
jgi:formylglycine-generating enzyme required for sulfatase activity